ncbi:MAG: ABC transporter substrate-binding protein, partial [Acidimicrobiales bacterium]
LVAVGPAQPRLDYQLVGGPSVATISAMKGRNFGWSNPHGVEAEMLGIILHGHGMQQSSITTELAGSSTVREAALLTGRIQATFLSTSEWDSLDQTHKGYHDLANMAVVAPKIADSFLATSTNFLKKNSSLVVAVDEAWLEAARVFRTNEKKWVAGALNYTAGTATRADAVSQYKAFKLDGAFPDSKDAFSTAAGRYNEATAKEVGALTLSPPLSHWFTTKFWNTAFRAVQAHKK